MFKILNREFLPSLILGVVFLPLTIIFMNTVDELNIIRVSDFVFYLLYLLIFIFAATFLSIGLIGNFVADSREGIQSFEEDNLIKMSLKIKNLFIVFSITTLVWVGINLYIFLAYSNSENHIRLLYVLSAPIAINIVLLFICKNDIKPAHNSRHKK